jgi:MYXO-CTERM domain-containing protein
MKRILCFAATLASVLAVCAVSAHAQIDRGPYLQQGTPNAMTVTWRTSADTEGVVCWGSTPSALTSRATGPVGRQHEVRITGLAPDTRYHYAVATGACPPAVGGDEAQFFVTAPTPGTRRPFRFWLVGDSGTGGSRQMAVRDAMLAAVGAMRPDIYLHVGDMAYSTGTTSEFDDNFFAPYASVLQNTVCWPAMGNHEGGSSDSGSQSGPYYDAYVLPTDGAAGGLASGTEAYYAFDWANVHFVILDSHDSPREPTGAMLRWLEMDLDATDQEWIIASFHHPPYTKGSHDSDTEGQLVDMRENALPILEAAGVDVVVAGHSHIYERSFLLHGAYDTPTTAAGHVVDMGDGRADGDGVYVKSADGTLYVVAGHGGTGVSGDADHPVMFFSEVENGSCIVDVAGPSLTLRNIRYDGVESDHVTLVKGEGLFLLSPLGGESFMAGSNVEITWTSAGTVGDVRIEASVDGGASWATVVDATPNDGAHTWTTPLVRTSTARVRLTDVDDASHVAESGDFELAASSRDVVIPLGSIWEYDDQGMDLGDTWRTELGGWPSGPAELGYGDGDEATTLRDDDPNAPTVYVRRGLELTSLPTAAELRLRYDDGVAVFVNGVQVAGVNVDDGVGFATWASAASADNEMTVIELDLGVNPFVVGENVIAAVVKQSSDTSSDLSFDLELTLETEIDLPGVDGGVGPGGDGGVGPGGDGGAGSADGGTGSGEGGCGCRVAGRGAGRGELAWASVAAVGLVTMRRRRRRGTRRRRRVCKGPVPMHTGRVCNGPVPVHRCGGEE